MLCGKTVNLNNKKEAETVMLNQNEIINKSVNDLKKYSPVIIVGKSGTGKTHMLNELMNSVNDKKVRKLTGEEICGSIIEEKSTYKSKWRNSLLEQSVLLIDDIDYLKNRYHTQEELLLVLESSNRPVVVTLEKPLNDECFSHSFISYFVKGTIVHLEMSDMDKTECLQKCILENELDLTDGAVEWLCQQNFPNYAEIQGFVKSMHLLYSQQNHQITLEECQSLFFRIKLHR